VAQGDDAAITGAIVALAQELDMCSVAEGVETPAQADWLRAKGCDRVQGYLFSRPVEEAAVLRTVCDAAWNGKQSARPCVALVTRSGR